MNNLKLKAETAKIKHLINDVYPSGIVSIVCDTFDFWSVLTYSLPLLKDEILARPGDMSKVVIRPDCYDDQTEVLTDTGFKLFKDLTDRDLVAQVHDDGTSEFVKPLKYIEQDYEGDMIHFTNEHRLDILVTPNHRMVKSKNGIIKTVEASEIKFSWPDKFFKKCKSTFH